MSNEVVPGWHASDSYTKDDRIAELEAELLLVNGVNATFRHDFEQAEAALSEMDQEKLQYIGAISLWVESLPTLLSNVIDEVTADLRARAEEGSYTTGVWPDYEPTQPPGDAHADDIAELEAELAERDRMLRLAAGEIELRCRRDLDSRGLQEVPGQRAVEILADLRDRAGEGA